MQRTAAGLIILVVLLLTLGGVAAQDRNARVIDMWNYLNVRTTPARSAAVVAELPGRAAITVTGRTANNSWYRVQTPDGDSGWVAAGYVDLLDTEPAALAIIEPDEINTIADSPSAASEIVVASSSDAGDTESDAAATSPLTDANGTVEVLTRLNLRAAPTTLSEVTGKLTGGTAVKAIGRTNDNAWLRVETENDETGWVAARYVRLSVAVSSLPADTSASLIAAEDSTSDDAAASVSLPAGNAPYFVLGATSREIFQRGQAMGNRANVFSKVGDSISVANVVYSPLVSGQPIWGDYGYLQSTVNYFSADSFTRNSLAAQNGWTTAIVNDTRFASQDVCQPNESPLACEYRLNKPAVALIMLGTNDVANIPSEQFANNLRVIVDYSAANGVIPVLSTIPVRRGYEPQTAFYNELIVQVAREKGISLWDYGAVMGTLPNAGLSGDGVHPSIPPDGFAGAANFRDNLQYGYVMRNLTALQALDTLRRNVLP